LTHYRLVTDGRTDRIWSQRHREACGVCFTP